MQIVQHPTFQWARFYATEWQVIPILLHSVVEWYTQWNPDTNQYEQKPVCSCNKRAKCDNPGKHPIVGWKQKPMSTPSEGLQTIVELIPNYPHAGLALRTGPESGLCVIDVDIKPHKRGDMSLQEGLARHGIPFELVFNTLCQRTGSGGYHFLFKYPAHAKVPTITDHPAFGPGVDIKGDGGMFNVQPSIHKNGQPYEWQGTPSFERVFDLPDPVCALVEKKLSADPYAAENAALEAYTPDSDDLLELAHRLKTQRKSRKLREIGKNLEKVTNGEPILLDGGAHDGFRDMMFQIASEWPLCDTDTVLELIRPGLEARMREKPDASTGLENLRDSLVTAQRKAEEYRLSWAGRLKREPGGTVAACFSNYQLIFENDPDLKNSIYFDARFKTVYARKAFGGLPGQFPRTLLQNDRTRIAAWLENKHNMRISRSRDVWDVIQAVANSNGQIDPFAEWIQALAPWDGYRRLETFMQVIAGAEDSEWTRTIMPMWFRGFVHRILVPGYKNDTMLILEGPQGYRKSTFFRKIVPWDRLYNDSLHRLQTDEATLRLLHTGAALHEIGDLASFSRSTRADLKAFLSATQDAVRPLYGESQLVHRNFIIVGTTNDSDYLDDPTGLRRFLPLAITRPIDLDALESMREQLFAEALWGINHGLPDHATPELFERFGFIQAAREREPDVLVQIIQEYLDREVIHPNDPSQKIVRVEVSVKDIAMGLLELEPKDLAGTKVTQIRVVDSLKRLGWRRIRRSTNNVWIRPGHV